MNIIIIEARRKIIVLGVKVRVILLGFLESFGRWVEFVRVWGFCFSKCGLALVIDI